MTVWLQRALPALLVLFVAVRVSAAIDPASQTCMLRSPTVSATELAFAYANNIWIVQRSGGDARRLTSF